MINLRTRQARRLEAIRQLRLRDALQRGLTSKVASMLAAVVNVIAATPTKQMTKLQADHLARGLEVVLSTQLTMIALRSGRRLLDGVGKAFSGRLEHKVLGKDELDKQVLQWARKHSAKRVGEIARTTRERVNRVIVNGLADDLSPREIGRRLRQVADMSRVRAETIARTETATAFNTGQQLAMESASSELGVPMKKVWLSTQDDRTRPTHSEADGQTVDLDNPFSVGNIELLYPGDPSGEPEEIINCRCTVTYETE